MIYAPLYYRKFKCIAERCRHSCCVGWRVEIDEACEARLNETALGEKMRSALREGEDGKYIEMLPGGRCPFLDGCGLCEIISTVGQGYLADICREHPRFYNRVGERLEVGIGASCEEAARLILSESDFSTLKVVGEYMAAADVARYDITEVRDRLLLRLSDEGTPYREAVREIESEFGVSADMTAEEWAEIFGSLEYLDEAHRALFTERCVLSEGAHEIYLRRFLGYLIYRHTGEAESYAELCARIGFALIGARAYESMLAKMGANDFVGAVECARIFSEEIEYSLDNTDELIFEAECRLL